MRRTLKAAAAIALLLALALALAVPLGLQLAPALDLRALLQWLGSVPAWLLLLILLAAPLAGVPLSALLVVVGARFPPTAGFAVAVTALAAHHLLIFLLARTRLWERLHAALSRRRLLPGRDRRRGLGDQLLFILAATWVPGLSYIFKVALTALAGIPFRTYFVAGVTSQTVAAAPFLVLGQVAEDANLPLIGALVFAIAALSWLVKRAVFSRARVPLPHDGGE